MIFSEHDAKFFHLLHAFGLRFFGLGDFGFLLSGVDIFNLLLKSFAQVVHLIALILWGEILVLGNLAIGFVLGLANFRHHFLLLFGELDLCAMRENRGTDEPATGGKGCHLELEAFDVGLGVILSSG